MSALCHKGEKSEVLINFSFLFSQAIGAVAGSLAELHAACIVPSFPPLPASAGAPPPANSEDVMPFVHAYLLSIKRVLDSPPEPGHIHALAMDTCTVCNL